MTCAAKTTCPYCGVGCGVLATPDGIIAGDPDHPANFGRLCSKGSALGETIGLEDRILHPVLDGARVSWDSALDTVARRFTDTIAEHGPDSVAFYVSGQLLTEDYYVANKLMKGFIGSANIDTNSRLCMASTVAGHRRAFGADLVPGCYEDLEEAEVIVLVGSNLAWCHPVLFQRIEAAKRARPDLRIVTVDPRRTATSALSDLHLSIAPGTDVALFNGLLAQIARCDALDPAYIDPHVSGWHEALAAAFADDPADTGLSSAERDLFFEWWIGTEKVVTVFSQGVNQSSSGTDKVNAIINCHLVTGRIGKPGCGPLSVTGQPNAMGGREVGGLANTLAAHLTIEDPAHRLAVRDFWDAPTICTASGLKAVDLFEGCADGRIKALWIMSTNPAVSLPRADAVRDAIRACDFTVVTDIVETDTTALANAILPAAGWGEKSGTVTNSERRISRQRAFLPIPGEARPDWRILCDVAARMGWAEAFDYDGPAAIFREHAALSGIAASLGSDFDISGLAALSDTAYDALDPVQWPVPARGDGPKRFFAKGGYFTSDRKARMIPVSARTMAVAPSPAYPLRLNTGRIRDQWHTMTRTARAARLNRHIAEPFAEIHPENAAAAGIDSATLTRVTTPDGDVIVRALITDRVPLDTIFVPMHWTGLTASRGRVGATVTDAVDPVSGQPELKGSVARIASFGAAWYGFAVMRNRPEPDCAYWARARIAGGWQVEIAGEDLPASWSDAATALIGLGEITSLTDAATGTARIAITDEAGLRGVFFAAPHPVAIARGWVVEAFGAGSAPAELLAGRARGARLDRGAIVCSCNDVGINTILAAIDDGALTMEAIGGATCAGTTCGSCRSELATLLAIAMQKVAAE